MSIRGAMLRAIVALFAILPLTAFAQDVDIAVSILESADPVTAGSGAGNLTYTVMVTNNGPDGTSFLVVRPMLTLPAGVTVDSDTASAGVWAGSNWEILDLLSGASETLTFTLTVSNTASAGLNAIGINAQILGVNGTDPDDTNDAATESTSITTLATFQVSKDFSDDNTASVEVQLTCNDQVVDQGSPKFASEATPAELVVSDFPANSSCQVIETTVPAGYEVSYSPDCNIDPVLSSATYDCLITNTQLPVQFVVNKTFEDGNGAEVTVNVQCEDATVTPDDPTASGSDPAEFTIFDFPAEGTTCTATETVPAGYAQLSSTCTDVAIEVAGTPSCEFVNVPLRTTFEVTKEFTDGDNPTEVEVTINCFTGLPLQQSQVITEEQGVEFVVTDFDIGELDCEITEEALPGYTATYQPDGPGEFNAEGGCNFQDIGGGAENTCHIINNADPVDVEIGKVWVIEGPSGDQVDTSYKLTLYCDALIEDATYCHGTASDVEAPAGRNPSWQCKKNFYGDDTDSFVADVVPEYPESHCWVEEEVNDSYVEIDNGCGDLVISAGEGDSCTITNTVFFEGIPTLNQYGMALLALLMLGVGVVGFRRFA